MSEKDIRELLGLGAAAAVSVFPSRVWLAYSRTVSGLRYRREREKNFAQFAASMRSVLGIDGENQCEALFRAHLAVMKHRRTMLAVDELARRRNPPIHFIGAEPLHAALGRGKGAVIWASQFAFQTLAGKRALWEQGFRPIQISVGNHGFSYTSFGNAVINPVLRRAEDRYLKDRIVFERDGGGAVTRKILGLLDQGELIILTNNIYAGNMFVEMGFGERGFVSMATAPLSIVARRGTPFYSMAILETGPSGALEAIVEPIGPNSPEETAAGSGARDYAGMAGLAVAARDNLLRQFRRAPEQYLIPEGLAETKL